MKQFKTLTRYTLYTLLCVCFFSCTEMIKDYKISKQRIDSIQVITLQKDTVWIISRQGKFTRILPKNYNKEK